MAKIRSEVERKQWVGRWRASGLGCEKFARQNGLAPSSLYAWSQRFGEGTTPPSFSEVRVVGAGEDAWLEIRARNGCVVCVRGAVDEGQVRMLLRVAGEC